MKDFIKDRPTFERVEFWAVTTMFIFLVFFHVTDHINGDMTTYEGRRYGMTYRVNHFVLNLLRYVTLYLAFIFMTFKVVPQLVDRRNLLANILLTVLVLAIVAVVFGLSNYYLNTDPFRRVSQWHELQKSTLYATWLMLVFGFYSAIKYIGIYLLSNQEQVKERYPFVTPGGLIALIVWLAMLLFFVVSNAPHEVAVGWFIIPLCGILFYWFALYKLIPISLRRRHPFRAYLLRSLITLAIMTIPVGIFAAIMIQYEDAALAIGSFNFFFHLVVTTPLAYLVYRRMMKGNEEIFVLKEKLGRSTANFDFLRSQINPHFLFNALNTIYGTAIQEKADRTSEGIEKLSDMMRFMLQENMQDKISLTRELDYLNNYISLQRLRTDTASDIRIQSDVQEEVGVFQIPPMILIPFVENAFKHGISFREPSHIKINLEVRDKTLYFDVYNSKHEKQENDPEKHKSGIGLMNVRQRLQMAYPGRHELVIRETQKEFFVHLTIQLS